MLKKENITVHFQNLYDKYINKDKKQINNLRKKVLTENEKQNIIESIVPKSQDSDILTMNTFNDLEFFSNLDNTDISLFDKLNNTYTIMGKENLKNILKNPINNINLLNDRQKKIKYLLNNKTIYENIKSNFLILKEMENELLWFWKKMEVEEEEYLDIAYFKHPILKIMNDSKICLRLYNYYQLIICPFLGVFGPVIFFILPYLILRFFYKIKINFKVYFEFMKISYFGVNDMISHIGGSNTNFTMIMKVFSTSFYFLFYMHGTLSTLEIAKTTNKINNIIHDKLNKLSLYIRKSVEIENLVSKELLDKKPITKEELFPELWDNIYNQEPNVFSNKGEILVTFNQIKKNKDKLIKHIENLGVIDSYLSIAILYNENKNDNIKYCFSNYIESKNNNGQLDIKNVWHPYLNKENIEVNSINLGKGNIDNKINNMLLTGANASGKSTFIKSVTIAIILSQTLTISCASEIFITPFRLINTYLNIPDCKGKESLFEAEMHRSKKHIDLIKKLKPNEYSFVIMDEIFSSTNPEEGISGAYSIADYLGKIDSSMSIITTHYQYLTELEKNTKNFVNYKMPVTKNIINNETTITYPYKLQKGISKQYIALDLLRLKGFDLDIVNKARAICNKITKKERKRKKKKEKLNNVSLIS